ncbi:MAG: hypothetical protein IKX54_01460 [Lachnospiraceae bacterium]|nr:hypothetical protein [Lachnospiraceae bacterium]
MNVLTIVLQAALWIWFLGAVISYRTKKFTLVDGMGVKSAEFFMLVLYSAGIAAFYVFPSAGRWILFGILMLWFVAEFMFHWRYTIFGATQRKIDGYNKCFEGTLCVFPRRETRLVPDLYHIVQHLLILGNIFCCLIPCS